MAMVATTLTPPLWRKRWAARLELWHYTSRRAHRAISQTATRLRQQLAPAWMSIGGLGSLVAAAWQLGTLAGLLTLGVAFFALEWRVSR
jgi:hypothetical protein